MVYPPSEVGNLLLNTILEDVKLLPAKIGQVSFLPIHDANRNRHERRIYSNYVAFAGLLRLFGRYGRLLRRDYFSLRFWRRLLANDLRPKANEREKDNEQ